MAWRSGAVAVVLLPSCSLLVDLTGLGDGRDAGDAGLADAANDGCAPPDFCDDFDHGALGAKWTNVSIVAGTIGLDTAALSAPKAFRSTLEVSDGGIDRFAQLLEDFPSAHEIHCTFQVFVRTQGTERARLVSIFVSNPAFSAYELNVFMVPSAQATLEEWCVAADGGTCPFNGPQGFPALATGTWTKVELDVTYGKTIRISVNDVLAASIASIPETPLAEHLAFGARGVSWDVLYDDLVCRVVL